MATLSLLSLRRSHYLFIAYDTGFAAIKSLIEHAFALEMPQAIYLYRIAMHPQANYLQNICRAWADAMDNFDYHAIHIDTASPMQARISDALSDTDVAIPTTDVYLAAPQNMAQTISAMLLAQGLPKANLLTQIIAETTPTPTS